MPSTTSRRRWPVPMILVAIVLAPASAMAQADAGTAGVFGRYADQVVRIEVRESGSGAKSSVGSGFFVSADGHLISNYHVISGVIHDPDRYRAFRVESAGEAAPLQVLAVDVVHDLAVLRLDDATPRYFRLADGPVLQGDRLYSLGHPNDLGLSIVEGTYNGLLRHTLYPKIHFTGSINSGMSGGPTVTHGGRVVGINVATSGDQVSFLVPVEQAVRLVDRALDPDHEPPGTFLDDVASQVRHYQAEYLAGMFGGDGATVELGPFRVPTEPAPFFRCWGDTTAPRGERPYETTYHRCSTDDYLYIADTQRSGVVTLSHELITTNRLNTRRLFALYASTFGRDNTPVGNEEHVTSWRCATRNVNNGAMSLRSVLCLRGYRKLDGLYDAVHKVAVLGGRDAGLVSTLVLSGVTYDSVDALTGRYLEQMAWR